MTKPIEEFGWVSKKQGGPRYRRAWCRPCKNEQALDAQRRARERSQAVVREYLLTHPCVDCGEADLVVLEFDHVRGEKAANVSKLVHDKNIARLKAEMEKCEVVCANCHRRRTAQRAGFWRVMPSG